MFHTGCETLRNAGGPVTRIKAGPRWLVPEIVVVTSPQGAHDVLGRSDAVIKGRRPEACPLTFEGWRALLVHEALPIALRTTLEDPACTIALAHGYELAWAEAEARSLLEHAESHDLAVAKALRQELAGFEKRKREGGR